MGMGEHGWVGDTVWCGVDTRVAGFSLHNDQPFFLNLPPLLYIIVIMSCCGSDNRYDYFYGSEWLIL